MNTEPKQIVSSPKSPAKPKEETESSPKSPAKPKEKKT